MCLQDQYINHIINETGVTVLLRGRGSGHLGSNEGEEGQQPLHLFLSSSNHKSLEDARLLAENLLDTISRECGATRVPSCKVYNAVPPPQQLLIGVHSSDSETNPNLNSGSSSTCSAATSVQLSSVGAPVVTTALPHGQVAQAGGHLSFGHTQTSGFPHSQPLLSTDCTSYIGYAGIYPQATPLQQVALALRQSGPVTSTVSPVTSTTSVVPKSFSETGKRPPHKRKFQEAPAAVSQQGSGIQDSHKFPPSMEKEIGTVLPPKKLNNLPSNGTASPSLKSMLPPPPPRSISSMPPPAAKNMPPPPPPPPRFTSSVSLSRTSDIDSISKKANPTTVPDTLVKLMEYGDDDDDDDAEESEVETLKSNPNRIAASKPFWAVQN